MTRRHDWQPRAAGGVDHTEPEGYTSAQRFERRAFVFFEYSSKQALSRTDFARVFDSSQLPAKPRTQTPAMAPWLPPRRRRSAANPVRP
jgi:hypothetical protein